MRRSAVLVTAGLVLASLTAACSGPSTGTEVRSHEGRDAPTTSERDATVLANSSLGTALYRALATGNGNANANFVFSPLAVSVGLAMAGAGAAGTTASQLTTVQHVTPDLDLNAGLNAMLQEVSDLGGDRQSDVRKGKIVLQLPDSLWGQKDTRFRQPFLDTLARSFGTGIRVVDFRSDPEAARRAMNSWAAEQTKDNITELVPRGVIDDATRLEVTAAAYLQAPWDQRFDLGRSTRAPFTRLDGQTVTATMMGLQAPTGLLYARSDGWQAVELPYLGRQLAMVVLVPDAGRFADVESRFDGPELQRVLGLMRPTALDLRLPRFGFTTRDELDGPLSAIGAPAAFISGEADFSGMTADEALWIAGFSHQAFLSVDEEGTQGSAATVVPNREPSISTKLTSVAVDRPFIVMVVARDGGEPLVLGRVLDPTA
jgi:serpin B